DLEEPLAAQPEVPEVDLEEVAVVEPAQPVSPAQTLSRFRQAEVANEKFGGSAAAKPDGPEEATQSENTLGRIPLIRVRRGRGGRSRVSYLARLLSSF
ncbi:MAG: hypothetical protein V3T64_14700, partial [Myxococcota bacterium]